MEETKNTIPEMLSIEELQQISGGRDLEPIERADYDIWNEWKKEKHKELRDSEQYDLDLQFTKDVNNTLMAWHTDILNQEEGDLDILLFSDYFRMKHPEYYPEY